MFYHITPVRNLKSIMRNGLIPKIGPRSRKVGERYPMVHLFTSMDALEDALMNWMETEFTGKLAILQVKLSANCIFDTRLFEKAWIESSVAFPPEDITLIRIEE